MRISSEQQFQQGIDSILTQQAKLNITQEQVASGDRILTPSDDPAAATQILKLSALVASNEQFERNVVFAQNSWSWPRAAWVMPVMLSSGFVNWWSRPTMPRRAMNPERRLPVKFKIG